MPQEPGWLACLYRAAEQRAEVAPSPLDGGVLVQDLAVDIAPGGEVLVCAVAAGMEGGIRAHHLPGLTAGAAVAGAPEDHYCRVWGPSPVTAADRYHDGRAVAGVDRSDPAIPPSQAGMPSASIAHIAYTAGKPSSSTCWRVGVPENG